MSSEPGSIVSPDAMDIDYDRDLPANHSYLGNLCRVSNTPFYPEYGIVQLPFICIPDLVLMISQEAPIHITSHELNLESMFNSNTAEVCSSCGFVCMASPAAMDHEDLEPELSFFRFGTVVSVVKMQSTDRPANLDTEGLHIIVRGSQRCYLLESELRIEGFHHRYYGKFRILPESGPRPPLSILTPSEWRVPLSVVPYSTLYTTSFLTASNPTFFLDTDAALLVEKIEAMMPVWNLDKDHPKDPTEFSFWLASNVPMSAGRRLQLLGAVSVVHRLFALLMMMRKYNRVNCSECGNLMAEVKDMICMNRGKLTAAYINPSGLTQELFAVSKVTNNIRFHGAPTAEFTWFPGYKWRHMSCRSCYNHVGWEYIAENARRKPRAFCGLKRGDVLPGTAAGTDLFLNQKPEDDVLMTPVYYREGR